MFTALADKNMAIKENIHKFISLSPCVQFKTTFKDESITEKYFEDGLYNFNENGIRSYKGPNWNIELARICGQFDEKVCEEYKRHSQVELYPGIKHQPTSMKNLIYYW